MVRQLNPSRRRWALVAAAGTLVAAGAGVAGTHGASAAAAGCQVSYAISAQWPGGFGANVTITNLGDPVTTWRLAWSFTAGQTITQLWNGSFTQSGAAVTVTNAAWNGTINTGGTASFGFNGAWTGSNPVPASFALNGTTCTGAVTSPSPTSGPPTPTSSPSPTPSPTPTSSPATNLPCDIYAAGGTPCVAAHSTTRALFAAYNGPLYQVRRSSDNTTTTIGVLATGGYANAAAQDSFCANTTCVITEIFDQSSRHNNLTIAGPGGNGGQDAGVNATRLPVTAGGHKVYGAFFEGGMGYRDNAATGTATGSQPEGMYMVTSGTHFNSGCCFDYGNMETNSRDNGNGHMDAIYFGTLCWFSPCNGSGPWIMADLENGLWQSNTGGSQSTANTGNRNPFVTAMLKNNGTNFFALKDGNAASGGLSTRFSGALPTSPSGYSPMHLEGAIGLGTGGDNSNVAVGSFFEGCMTAGLPSDATENTVQANIVTVAYH